MAAKLIQVSDDAGANWHTLPGGSGNLNREAGQIGDTIFGATYQSNEAGVINWNIGANALYKGFAGYLAEVKKQGTSTAMTVEAMSLVAGKTFKIDDTAKEIWDRSQTLTVFDNAIDHNADVEFDSGYTVLTPVTVTGNFFPTVVLGQGTSFTLSQGADAIQTTTFVIAQANGGYHTFDPGLRTVGLEMANIFADASGFNADILARTEFIIELDPVGDGLSICRGFYKLVTVNQDGDVGALEEETINFNLNVPEGGDPSILTSELPFDWRHDALSTLSTSVQKMLEAFTNETKLDARYLHDGVNGQTGQIVVTDLSLSGGLEAMNDFTVTLQGDGVLTNVP